MKKTLVLIIFPAIMFGATQVNNHNLLGSDSVTYTPRYLSIPSFQKCLGKEAVQDALLWCLPKIQPDECPSESWDKLQTVNLVPCISDEDAPLTEQMPGIALATK